MTGKARASVTRKLKESGLQPVRVDGASIWYTTRLALPILYGGIAVDPMMEKAKLDVSRRKMVDLQILQKQGLLVDSASVESHGAAVMNTVAMKVMSLRTIAPEVRAARTDVEGAEIIEEACREALSELARIGEVVANARSEVESDHGLLALGDEATAEGDGESMGGREAEA